VIFWISLDSERFEFLSLYKGMALKWGTYYHRPKKSIFFARLLRP